MANKALGFGNNNYPGTYIDLQVCLNDAEDWASKRPKNLAGKPALTIRARH